MRYIYSAVLLICAVLGFFYSTRVFYNDNYKKSTFRLFALMSLNSGFWSLGFGVMFALDNCEIFKLFRIIGMIGVIFLIISGQMLISVVVRRVKNRYPLILAELVSGAIFIIVSNMPGSYTLSVTDMGVISAEEGFILSIVHVIYIACIFGVFVYMVFDTIRSDYPKRIKSFGKSCMAVVLFIMVGIGIDIVLMLFDIANNVPATSILQFFGIEVIYNSVHRINRNRIYMENMTGYIYNSLRSPVLVFDVNHKLQLINRAAGSFFAMDEYGVDKWSWSSVFDMEPPKAITDKETTDIYDVEYGVSNINCRLYVNSIFDEYNDRVGYIVVVTDMTEQIRAMKAIEQAKDAAESANKAKSMFLANMSHEIRTPMNSILGFSELGLRDDTLEKSKEYFSDIHESAEILLATINEILDISKLESGKLELVCADYYPSALFKDVALIINMQAKRKNLKFDMDIADEIPNKLYGDKARIREILINLLNNGVKYTNEGAVSLKAQLISKKEDMCRLRFVITDTGIGIKAEDIKLIFDSFRRCDHTINSRTEGTGLGLSITKGFVELMDGDISVSSVYGKGSVFTVEIDQKIIEDKQMGITYNEDISDKRTKVRFNNLKVLAVDDNMINLKVVTNVLDMYGIAADTVNSGEKAIEKCKENDYDIILMDQMMPVMDGVMAMKRIRELNRGYEHGGPHKIIVLTANTVNGMRQEMLDIGFDGFLGKPVNFNVIEKVFMEMYPDSYCIVEDDD